MSENSQNKSTGSDEIDLMELFRRICLTLIGWSKALGRAILFSVVFFLKRWLPLGISLIAGIGLSYFLKSTSESFYTSDMVIRNNTIPNADMISYINRLHTYCLENNKTALANSLSFNSETVKNVLDISAFWVIDKARDGVPDEVDYLNNHNIYDTLNVRMQDRLDIRAKIKYPQELTLLQNSIISFINEDSLFQQKNRLRIRLNKDLLTRFNYEILQLDTLQKRKIFEETKSKQPQVSGQWVFLQEQKTQLVYTDIYNLFSKKQSLESERDLYKDIVTVLSNFNLPAKPENGTLFYGKHIIPLFFGLTLLLLIILANRRKLKEVYNKY